MFLDLYTYSSSMYTCVFLFQVWSDLLSVPLQWKKCFIFHDILWNPLSYYFCLYLFKLLMILFFHFFIWVLKTSTSFIMGINIYIPENLGRFKPHTDSRSDFYIEWLCNRCGYEKVYPQKYVPKVLTLWKSTLYDFFHLSHHQSGMRDVSRIELQYKCWRLVAR